MGVGMEMRVVIDRVRPESRPSVIPESVPEKLRLIRCMCDQHATTDQDGQRIVRNIVGLSAGLNSSRSTGLSSTINTPCGRRVQARQLARSARSDHTCREIPLHREDGLGPSLNNRVINSPSFIKLAYSEGSAFVVAGGILPSILLKNANWAEATCLICSAKLRASSKLPAVGIKEYFACGHRFGNRKELSFRNAERTVYAVGDGCENQGVLGENSTGKKGQEEERAHAHKMSFSLRRWDREGGRGIENVSTEIGAHDCGTG